MKVRPFRFEEHLGRPEPRWSFLPWVNVTALFVLLGVTTSRLVFVPGMEVALPAVETGEAVAAGNAAVLTVIANGQMFLEGRRVGERDLEAALRAAVAAGSRHLLVRIDGSVRAEDLLQVAALARRAGMQGVQIPVEPDRPAEVRP
jgi:biopolymer transport protein ExbD